MMTTKQHLFVKQTNIKQELEILLLLKKHQLPFAVQLDSHHHKSNESTDTNDSNNNDNNDTIHLHLPILNEFKIQRYPIARIAKYIRQLMTSLDRLHALNVVHLDVTRANIMLDHTDDLVLIDFGLSEMFDCQVIPYCGTLGFIAPGKATPLFVYAVPFCLCDPDYRGH
jgi:serine/threonine protein kinase